MAINFIADCRQSGQHAAAVMDVQPIPLPLRVYDASTNAVATAYILLPATDREAWLSSIRDIMIVDGARSWPFSPEKCVAVADKYIGDVRARAAELGTSLVSIKESTNGG